MNKLKTKTYGTWTKLKTDGLKISSKTAVGIKSFFLFTELQGLLQGFGRFLYLFLFFYSFQVKDILFISIVTKVKDKKHDIF
jgi:hypothetical protein